MQEDPPNNTEVSPDPDTASVVEMMLGAIAGPHDPDVELAKLLPHLEGQDGARLIPALERLVRNAHKG
jgi:hypothetical protein